MNILQIKIKSIEELGNIISSAFWWGALIIITILILVCIVRRIIKNRL